MDKVIKTMITGAMFVSSIVLADGIYLGGQVGFEKSKVDRVAQYTPFAAAIANKTKSGNTDSNKSYFSGGVYGGYKMQLQNNMTLAIEADGFLLGSKKYEETGVGGVLKDKTGYMLGLSVLGGYVLDNKLEVYGRLGLSHTSIQFQHISLTGITGSLNKKKTINPIGIAIGAGIQMSLASLHESLENVSARFDYRYIHYQKKDLDLEDNLFFERIEYKLNKHVVMLGVDYRF